MGGSLNSERETTPIPKVDLSRKEFPALNYIRGRNPPIKLWNSIKRSRRNRPPLDIFSKLLKRTFGYYINMVRPVRPLARLIDKKKESEIQALSLSGGEIILNLEMTHFPRFSHRSLSRSFRSLFTLLLCRICFLPSPARPSFLFSTISP